MTVGKGLTSFWKTGDGSTVMKKCSRSEGMDEIIPSRRRL